MADRIKVTPEELRTLGGNFQTESGSVQQLMGKLDSQLRGVDWAGNSAMRFQAQWEDEFRPVLVNLSDALDHASARLAERARSAEDYDRA